MTQPVGRVHRGPTCSLCGAKRVKRRVGRIATKMAPFDDPDYVVQVCLNCDLSLEASNAFEKRKKSQSS